MEDHLNFSCLLYKYNQFSRLFQNLASWNIELVIVEHKQEFSGIQVTNKHTSHIAHRHIHLPHILKKCPHWHMFL